ncbi:MAG: ABC transporter permease [Planctomycetota bacterium]|nr:MAG: ABC transporter permease [Planctomycetota bacterium]
MSRSRSWLSILPRTELVRFGGLVVLCAALGLATIRVQYDADAAAGGRLGRDAAIRAPTRVLIVIPVDASAEGAVASPSAGDLTQSQLVAFADAARSTLLTAHPQVKIHEARGDTRAIRKVLEQLNRDKQRLDLILTTHEVGRQALFEDLVEDFPDLGTPALLSPQAYHWPTFFKVGNLLNIADRITVIAVLAVGMTLVIITGGIDLSVGSLIAFSAVLSCLLIQDYGGGLSAGRGMMLVCSLAGITVGTLFGLMNGLLITQLRMPPFIVTLATMLAVSGGAYMLTGGESAHQIPATFTWLGRGTLMGLPASLWLLAVLYAIAHFVMLRTPGGRYLYAVGGNREAARLSGIHTERVLLAAYLLSGLLAGFGGVIMASQYKSGSPMFGQTYELKVIAAVVVGGTSLSGGRGTMIGTLIGALMIAVIENGMNLLQVEPYLQKVVLGLVILIAVGIDQRSATR